MTHDDGSRKHLGGVEANATPSTVVGSNEMVERVARAMDSVTTGPEAGEIIIREIFSAELWRMMSARLARAAVASMREPTKEMCAAAWHSASDEDCDDHWRAMIDEALK